MAQPSISMLKPFRPKIERVASAHLKKQFIKKLIPK